ncbi:MAG: 4-demethylwyosine synthase TYW1 [Candidatus Lokiarchaeota archaeon]|nr:4-demethylwyosine synthase TYW1 [Candidatus Lokiarchaeota archaeon]
MEKEYPKEYKVLKKQKYHVIGKHSAIKKCRWTHNSLVKNQPCYKEKFYNLKSHRCLQMSPSVIWCTNNCLYCWRVNPEDCSFPFSDSNKIDDPDFILDGCYREWKRILSGYKPTSHDKVSWKKWNEAQDPFNIAISLSGEPTLYPKINGLIEASFKRNLKVFLVSNGTQPNVIESLTEPSQLYISLSAPNRAIYEKTCLPALRNNWDKLMRSLELLSTFKCPTVIRLTMVKDLNMCLPKEYAKIINKVEPTYIECKGYVYVGSSRKNLTLDNMPYHHEIKDFSEKLSNLTGYNILDEHKQSRVVLLSKLKKAIKFS